MRTGDNGAARTGRIVGSGAPRTQRRWARLAAILVLVVVAAACGGDDSDDASNNVGENDADQTSTGESSDATDTPDTEPDTPDTEPEDQPDEDSEFVGPGLAVLESALVDLETEGLCQRSDDRSQATVDGEPAEIKQNCLSDGGAGTYVVYGLPDIETAPDLLEFLAGFCATGDTHHTLVGDLLVAFRVSGSDTTAQTPDDIQATEELANVLDGEIETNSCTG